MIKPHILREKLFTTMLISPEAENFKNYNANCNKVNAEISGNLHRRFPKDLHLNKSDKRSDYVSKVVINV